MHLRPARQRLPIEGTGRQRQIALPGPTPGPLPGAHPQHTGRDPPAPPSPAAAAAAREKPGSSAELFAAARKSDETLCNCAPASPRPASAPRRHRPPVPPQSTQRLIPGQGQGSGIMGAAALQSQLQRQRRGGSQEGVWRKSSCAHWVATLASSPAFAGRAISAEPRAGWARMGLTRRRDDKFR